MNTNVVLIADFFGSLKARGIPAYIRDLEAIAHREGISVYVLRAPRIFRRLPTGLQNLLMVIHEQLVVPVIALLLRPSLVLFPYNSASILCSLSRRCVCIIHDLIPYRRSTRTLGLAYFYLLATTSWHAWLGRPVAGASPYTMRVLENVNRFRRCPKFHLPNCFAATPPCTATPPPSARQRLTLISGHGANKDFVGALKLFLSANSQAGFDLGLDVIGFGDKAPSARAIVDSLATPLADSTNITIHEYLPQPALDGIMRDNAVTWAHSLAEGFGRAVVEGRMSGRPVLMSRLPVFKVHADEWAFTYQNGDSFSFTDALRKALSVSDRAGTYLGVNHLQGLARASLLALLQHASKNKPEISSGPLQ